jgi:hypothetical protein
MTAQVNQPVNFGKLTGPQLAHIYNQLVGANGQVKKFRDIGSARARVQQALDDKGLSSAHIVNGPGGAPVVKTKAEVDKAWKESGLSDAGPIPAVLKRSIPTPEEEVKIKKQQTVDRREAATKMHRKDKKIHAKARKQSYLKQTGVSKKDKVLKMISAKGGATSAEMIEETGWLPHTLRATISGHRKKGHKIVAKRKAGVTTYTIG